MAAKLERTNTPGVFRRHAKGCGGGRCACPYVVVWRYRGKQHKETHRTLAEAREAKGIRDAGDRRPVTRVVLGEYFDQWIETYAGRTARGFSETTRPEYRRPIERHAIPRWGSWRLADVESADVRELFGELRRDNATTPAIKKLRAALSAMFATAVEDGHLRTNPVQGVRIPARVDEPDEDESEPAKALTRAELARVLNALPDNWQLFFEFLAHTGLRISEAVGLTWRHIDLGANARIRVREQVYRGKRRRLKTRHGRRDLPLSARMADQLRAHRRDTFRGDDAPVFASTTGTELIPGKVARRILKPAGVAAGLLRPCEEWDDADTPESWITFHSFRHSCASLLFDAGRNVKQVQEWLGHADPAFTLRRYVHLLDEGVGDPDFLDDEVTAKPRRGNTGATRGPNMPAAQVRTETTEIAD